VQGRDAVPQLLEAIALASARNECEVLIVARGGGSIEDLWAFNDEAVARALRVTPMPVVTGIGHEVDFTIADFVADLRAPTPSGAAELVVPDGATWRAGFARVAQRLLQAIRRQLRNDSDYLVAMRRRLALAHPGQRLRQNAQRLDELEQRLGSRVQLLLADRRHRLQTLSTRLARISPAAHLQRIAHRHAVLETRLHRALAQQLDTLRQKLATLARTLDAVSPLATLDRGFALVTRVSDGVLLRDAEAVASGDLIDARLAKGRVRAKVIDSSSGDNG
jgi:exodeoxyribonuclease VII large subunit